RRCVWSTELLSYFFFFFQAEDGIRDATVTGVQTCALPILRQVDRDHGRRRRLVLEIDLDAEYDEEAGRHGGHGRRQRLRAEAEEIGRASCREREEIAVGGDAWERKRERWSVAWGGAAVPMW